MSEATHTLTLTDFLLARFAEDEDAARLCAEMFPPPWDVADRGWRVRIYASDVSVEDLTSDDPDATTTRNPVVMEVEPDRHIEDPRWLSERVEHVRRHDPAHVLAECESKRRIVELHRQSRIPYEVANDLPGVCLTETSSDYFTDGRGSYTAYACATIKALASVYSDHPDYRDEWAV
jgi:hypothetical protein